MKLSTPTAAEPVIDFLELDALLTPEAAQVHALVVARAPTGMQSFR
jgi:hypothetical protein